MKRSTQVILDNMDKNDFQIKEEHSETINNIDNINNIFVKYYVDRGVNNKTMYSAFKTQSSFNAKQKDRSFACLLLPQDSNTMQKGYLGQLDYSYYDIMLEIYKDVTTKMPFITDEASKIFTFMGALPSPLVCEPPSSRLTRKDIGLPEDTNEEYNLFLENFVFFIFKSCSHKRKEHVSKITSNGNPGLPDFIRYKDTLLESGRSYYKEHSFSIYKKAQINTFANLINKNYIEDVMDTCDFKKAFLEYGLLFFYRDQHRGQPDVFSKERFGFTKDSWSKKEEGQFIKLDRQYVIDKYFKDFPHLQRSYGDFRISSKKNRFVFAMSNSVNGPINIALSVIRENYGSKYPQVFKVSDRKQLSDHLNSWVVNNKIELKEYELTVFDITQYDNTFSRGMMKAYIKGIDRFNDNLASLIACNNGAPGGVMLPFDGLDIRSVRNKLFLTGNPFDIESFNFGIAPSGTGDVTEKAKLPCLAFVLYTVLKAMNKKLTINNIEEILEWRNKECIVCNLGDNNLVLSHKRLKMSKYISSSDVLKVDISPIGVFGGLMISKDDENNTLNVIDSPVSSLIKTLMPERPLDDPMRSSYYLGTIERYSLANDSKYIFMVLDAIDRALYNRFRAPSQYNLATRYLEKDTTSKELDAIYRQLGLYVRDNGMTGVSSFFLSVINSGGDKLFYTDLYDKMTSVEKSIIDNLFFTVLEEEVADTICKFFGIKEGENT